MVLRFDSEEQSNMILSTFSEEQILSELVKDFKKNVKPSAKKIADAYLLKAKKSGRFIRDTEYDSYTVTTVLNNKWNVEIEYDQRKKIPWLFRACCIVESDKKTKDYYIVRGINTDEPYFVKITTHALLRYRERNKMERLEVPLATIACLTFEHRETAICLRYIEPKFHQLLMEFDDTDDLTGMSYFVLTNRGAYYAQRTPEGNYVFKTYISTSMSMKEWVNYKKSKTTKWKKEGELLDDMIIIHQYYNKNLYDKDVLEKDLYSAIGKDVELERKENSAVILLRN